MNSKGQSRWPSCACTARPNERTKTSIIIDSQGDGGGVKGRVSWATWSHDVTPQNDIAGFKNIISSEFPYCE